MNKTLEDTLTQLKLSWIRENIDEEVAIAVRKNRSPHELIERLLEGELATRNARAVERRIRQAKLSRRPTLVDFDFNWPQKINVDQIRHLFSLDFIKNATNPSFLVWDVSRCKSMTAILSNYKVDNFRFITILDFGKALTSMSSLV